MRQHSIVQLNAKIAPALNKRFHGCVGFYIMDHGGDALVKIFYPGEPGHNPTVVEARVPKGCLSYIGEPAVNPSPNPIF